MMHGCLVVGTWQRYYVLLSTIFNQDQNASCLNLDNLHSKSAQNKYEKCAVRALQVKIRDRKQT